MPLREKSRTESPPHFRNEPKAVPLGFVRPVLAIERLIDKRSEHRPVFFFHAFSLILTFLRAVADPATLKSWEKYSNRLEADGSPAKPHLAIRLGQRRVIHMSSASPCTARRTLQLPDLLC